MVSSVDGLISGLSTSTIIDQMMQLESRPQTLLKTKVTTAQSAVTAYQAVNSKMSALLTATDALTSYGGWNAVKATSSTADVVVSASASASPASVTVTMLQTAAAESQLSTATYAGLGASATAGPIAVSVGGVAKDPIVPADGTLQSLVTAINARTDLGLRAAAVDLGGGNYRLQVSAKNTGAASSFTLGGIGMTVAVAGRDAQVSLAGDPTAVVSSPSNTFTGVLPGLTFTVTDKVAAGTAVTMSVVADPDALADRMSAVVDAANGALATIAGYASYDAANKKGGVLLSDFAVRQLQQQVLTAVPQLAGTTGLSTGVSLTRDGRLSFDRSAFLDSYAKDPSGLQQAVTGSGSSSSAAVSFVSAQDRTRAGTYAVRVDTAATQASTTNAWNAGTWRLKVGGVEVSASGADSATLASALQTAAAAKGLAVSISDSGGSLTVRTNAYGSTAKLDLDAGAGTYATSSGTDVVGQVGTVAGDGTTTWLTTTGSGQLLTVSDPGKSADGLALSATATGSSTFTYTAGVAARLGSVAWGATDADVGVLTRAISARQTIITDANTQIEAWDRTLELRRAALQRQYGALEVALGKLQSQSSWLSGQISSLPSPASS
jgi:flagellar hook-associated protein 2